MKDDSYQNIKHIDDPGITARQEYFAGSIDLKQFADTNYSERNEKEMIKVEYLGMKTQTPFLQKAHSVDMIPTGKKEASKIIIRKNSQNTVDLRERDSIKQICIGAGASQDLVIPMHEGSTQFAGPSNDISTIQGFKNSLKRNNTLSKAQIKQISTLKSRHSLLSQDISKLAESEKTQLMMTAQLKKYKAQVTTKHEKLGCLEAEIAERKKEVERKRDEYEQQVQQRCLTDKEALLRLKKQTKQMQAQHTNLKKQVIQEAKAVQELDSELSQQYEEQKLRQEWLDREKEILTAEMETYQLVLTEERDILEREKQTQAHLQQQLEDQCSKVEAEIHQSSQQMQTLLQQESDLMHLRHKVNDEEEIALSQIRHYENLKQALTAEIATLDSEIITSGSEMEKVRQAETETFFKQKQVEDFEGEIGHERARLDEIMAQVAEKESEVKSRQKMFDEKEEAVKGMVVTFNDEEEKIDAQIVDAEAQIHEMKKKIIAMEAEVERAEYQVQSFESNLLHTSAAAAMKAYDCRETEKESTLHGKINFSFASQQMSADEPDISSIVNSETIHISRATKDQESSEFTFQKLYF